jgi:hypothetical protein
MLDQTGKGMPGTNTLAYLASSSAMKEKSFIRFSPGGVLLAEVADFRAHLLGQIR